MTKLNRLLAVLLALQIGLLLALRLGSRGSAKPPARKLFEKLSVGEVGRLKIKGNDGKGVELEKRGGAWVLASGGGYPTQPNKVSELLAKLPPLAAGAAVSEKPEHQRQLEVAKDGFQREIRIEPGPGGKPLVFYLGTSAGIKDVHLRLEGERAIYLVKDLSAWDAGTAAADWVATDYLKLERDKIVALSVENSEGKLELTKGAGGKWAVAGLEEGAKINQTEVDSLLGSASLVSLQEPVGQTTLGKHGLEKPAATVSVVVEEKPAASKKEPKPEPKRTSHVLKIGAKEGDSYYAKSSGSKFVVKLAGYAAEPFLKKKAADLVEKKKDSSEKKDSDSPDSPDHPAP